MNVAWRRPIVAQGNLARLMALAALVMVLSVPGPLAAQKDKGRRSATPRSTAINRSAPKPNIVMELQKKHADLWKIKKAVFLGQESLARSDAELKKWYKELLLAMARTQEDVMLVRQELLKDLKNARTEELRVFLRDYLFATAPKLIAFPQASPAAKVNAMLLVGELNAVEGQRSGTSPSPPVPLPDARKVMLDELDNPNQIDAVKVAALVGLVRHVELEMITSGGQNLRSDQVAGATRIVQSMLNILQTPPPSSPGRIAGHHWMQRRAVEILGLFESAGPNGQIAAALDKVLQDKANPLWLRCAAVKALGRLTLGGQTPLNPDQTVKAIGMLAVDSCQAEVARLEQWVKKQESLVQQDQFGDRAFRGPRQSTRGVHIVGEPGRGSEPGRGEPGRGEPGRDSSDTEEPVKAPGFEVVLATRRRLKDQLGCIQSGLSAESGRGLRALAGGGAAQALIDQIDTDIKSILNDLDTSEIEPSELRQSIADRATQMANRMAGTTKPASTPPGAPTQTTPEKPDPAANAADPFSG